MAQRMIHYMIGEMLAQETELKDKNRFLIGSVIPDAYTDIRYRDVTHFRYFSEDRKYSCYDIDRFRNTYRDKILQDDLYLGYYMHLVEDVFYRRFIRSDHKITVFGYDDKVRILHRDYHVLNRYIRERWHLRYELTIPEDLENEDIFHIAEFEIPGFLKALQDDFSETVEEKTVYVTEEMIDEFMERYYPVIAIEFSHAVTGDFQLRAADYAWKRLPE